MNNNVVQDQEPQGSTEVKESTTSTPHQPLRLPRGAFLVFTKTGGPDSTPQALVLYPDGRVAYDAHGVNQKDYSRLRRVLNDAQVLGLRKLLDQIVWETVGQSQVKSPIVVVVEELESPATQPTRGHTDARVHRHVFEGAVMLVAV